MEGNPAALEEFRGLGVPRVPAVAVAGRVVHGWNPPGYAALVGVAYQDAGRLPAPELAARLDRVLAATERVIREAPARHLGRKHPGRDRSLLDLAYHVFRLSLGFADAMDFGGFRPEWLDERAPADLTDGAGVARYGALVRGRLAGWFEGAGPREFERVVEAYYGPQSGHELLERTTWHAAQHLRQLHALLGEVGAPPAEPLPVADFQGLPLPDSLW